MRERALSWSHKVIREDVIIMAIYVARALRDMGGGVSWPGLLGVRYLGNVRRSGVGMPKLLLYSLATKTGVATCTIDSNMVAAHKLFWGNWLWKTATVVVVSCPSKAGTFWPWNWGSLQNLCRKGSTSGALKFQNIQPLSNCRRFEPSYPGLLDLSIFWRSSRYSWQFTRAVPQKIVVYGVHRVSNAHNRGWAGLSVAWALQLFS